MGGARFEHLNALLGSPGALNAFHEVLLRVSAGRVPQHAAAALAASRLTPLCKPSGGVRPIAAPSILRRLAGRVLVRKRKTELAEALGPQQFAVGTAAGTELLAHTVRALTEADPDLTVLALDAKNAYCTASRAACLEQLELRAPDLLPCARLFSQRESQYFFWDGRGACHRLRATSGVDQGDPLAPVLFACGLAPHLQALEDELQELARSHGLPARRVRVLAYLDDVALLAPPELAAEALAAAERHLAVLGLELNLGKTQAWSARSACPPELTDYRREAGVTLVGVPLGDAMPAAGLPAPGDEARVDVGDHGYTKQRCEETAKRAEAFLARLADLPANASPHLPAVQVAALLLRMCGCGKITHMLRSNPPSTTREAARSFDATLLEAYTKLAELDPLTDAQAGQCQLPLNLGGRGLRSQERVAPAAWAASWAHCLPEVLRRSGVDELTDLETSALPLPRDQWTLVAGETWHSKADRSFKKRLAAG